MEFYKDETIPTCPSFLMFCWARKPLPVLPPAWGHGTLQAQGVQEIHDNQGVQEVHENQGVQEVQENQGVQEVQENQGVQEVQEVSSPTLGVPPLDLLKELLAELLPPNSILALRIYRGMRRILRGPGNI